MRIKSLGVLKCARCSLRNTNDPFLDRIVTCDEKWILYDNRKRSGQWLDRDEPPKHFPKPMLHQKKIMVTVWWSALGDLNSAHSWRSLPHDAQCQSQCCWNRGEGVMNILKVAGFLLVLGSIALGAKHDVEEQVSDNAKSNTTNEDEIDSFNRTKRQFILTRFELLPLSARRSNRFLVIPASQRQSTNANSNNQVGNIIIQPARIIFQRVLSPLTASQQQNEFDSARQNQANTLPNTSGLTRPQSTQSFSRPNAAIIVPLGGAGLQQQQQTLRQSQTPQRFQQVLTQPSRLQQPSQNIQPSFSRPSSNIPSSNVLVANQIFRQSEQDLRLQQQLLQRQQNFLRSFQRPGFQNFQNNFQNSGFSSLSSPFPGLQENPQNRFRTQQVEFQQRVFNNQAISRPINGGNFGSQNVRNPTTILRNLPTSTGGPAVQPTNSEKQIDSQNLSRQRTQNTQQRQLAVTPTRVGTSNTNAPPQTDGSRTSRPVTTSVQQSNISPSSTIVQPTSQPQRNTLSLSTSGGRLTSQNRVASAPSSSFSVSTIGRSNFGSDVGVPLPTVLSRTSSNSPNNLPREPVTPSFASQGLGVPLPLPNGLNTQASFNRGSGQQFFIRPESREIFGTSETLSSREFFDTREVLDSREFFDSRELFQSREFFDTREILSGANPALINNRPIFRSSVSNFDRTEEVISSEVFFRGRK
ncbi:Transposase type 1 [Trinorchestia longiramus]|nr:Transposase type 1 [Trinorchestia longiramus]